MKQDNNQRGMVSIMIAGVMMVIMALLTLGFTRVVQNEQRQAIDDQLSKQAFYAAESGINTAMSIPGFPGTLKEDCDVSGAAYNDGKVSADGGIAFTCVQINPNPSDLVFGNDSITTNRAKIVPIKTNPEATSLIIEWTDSNHDGKEATCSATNLDFDAVDVWTGSASGQLDRIAPLKFDLIGIPDGNFDRNALINAQASAILYPCSSGGQSSVDFTTITGASVEGSVGKVIPVNCTGGNYECRFEITNINAASIYRQHYIRFNSIYSEVNVRLTAGSSSPGDRPLFAGAQAVVDSTGRANDVYRRLQARVPLYDAYVLPNGTLQTVDDICKLYSVQTDGVTDDCN